MKKLVMIFAVGAAALAGGSAANAADNGVRTKAATDVTQPSTDISSSHRHWRHQHWSHRHYRPYYRSYGYAPRPYYNSYGYHQRPYGYYGGGPGVTFSFGSGGYRGW